MKSDRVLIMLSAAILLGIVAAALLAISSPWLGARWALASVAFSLSVLAFAAVSAVQWLSFVVGCLQLIARWALEGAQQKMNVELDTLENEVAGAAWWRSWKN